MTNGLPVSSTPVLPIVCTPVSPGVCTPVFAGVTTPESQCVSTPISPGGPSPNTYTFVCDPSAQPIHIIQQSHLTTTRVSIS